MHQADNTNIIKMHSRIELLWKRYEAAANEKERVEALWDEVWASNDATDIDRARAEAACDAAYDVKEDLADEILSSPIVRSKEDVAIKAHVFLARPLDPADLGYVYRGADLVRFIHELAALLPSPPTEVRP